MASQEPTGDYERVYLSERRSWRRWLEKNHAIQRGIWLVFYKKATRKPSLEYEESVEEAQRNGAWTVYDAIEDLVIPDDLAAALAEGTSAQETFGGFSISVRKNILWWIASARRPETRARRIAKTAAAVAENRNPL